MVAHCPAKRDDGGGGITRLIVPALLLGLGLLTLITIVVNSARRTEEPPNPFARAANPAAAAGTVTAATGAPEGASPTATQAMAGTLDMALPPIELGPPDPRAAGRVQNFSCDTARSPARKLVCTHWALATIDYNLALAYRQALESAGDPRGLRREQRAWLDLLDRHNAPQAVVRHYQRLLYQLSTPRA